jgi:hypothetical protein
MSLFLLVREYPQVHVGTRNKIAGKALNLNVSLFH